MQIEHRTGPPPASGIVPITLVGGVGGALAVIQLPPDATTLNPSSGNVANATAAATLPAVAGKTNYLHGFEITGAGATAGLAVTVTVTGVVGGPISYTYAAAAGPAVANAPLIVWFTTPLVASAPNTAIVVSCPALGAGNTNNTVVAHGYQV